MMTKSRRPSILQVGCLVVTLWSGSHAPALAADNQLTPEEVSGGWILLFDGETLFGWEPGSQADWRVEQGTIAVSSGEPGLLVTTSPFADYTLQCDFRAAAGTNSGIFLRTPKQPTDPAKDCYELNIAPPEKSPFATGSFVGRAKAAQAAYDEQWHHYEVTAQGGHFVVHLDGQQVLDYTDPAPLGRGLIGLQLNSGAVAFKNVKLRPDGLQPIFNGRNLEGWTVFPDKKAEFSVNESGELVVRKGNGQLETQGQWADFVLQLDVFVVGRGLNSGVFFRSIPGQFWQGYESQIQNAFRRTRDKPVDCGTGGFYRRQNARRIVADDQTWFTKTLVVAGPHMAGWVNGIQVSDWTDTRPVNANPREGLRLEAGTLSLQAHDSTTNLKFRGLRIVELSPR
ncbi:MAG: DUF1080 domain-containing protein [Pirellulales bacterium]|nr:DUF1080 domain-containing protein [Pirellulales bacterium]